MIESSADIVEFGKIADRVVVGMSVSHGWLRPSSHLDQIVHGRSEEDGWSLLHHEALAGNLGVVKLLLTFGADPTTRTPSLYTAVELARKIGWEPIADLFQR